MAKQCPLEGKKLEKEIRAMFQDWNFINGVGETYKKDACIMSAAHAFAAVQAGHDLASVEANDKLDCVSPILRAFLISRNDSTLEGSVLQKWALDMLPRIFGTNTTITAEKKRFKAVADELEKIYFAAVKVEASAELKHFKKISNLPTLELIRNYDDLEEAVKNLSFAVSIVDLDYLHVAEELRNIVKDPGFPILSTVFDIDEFPLDIKDRLIEAILSAT